MPTVTASNKQRRPTDPPWTEADFRVVPPHGPNEYPANYSFQGPKKWKRICELLYTRAETPWMTESDVMRAAVDWGLTHFGEAIGSEIITGMNYEIRMMGELVSEARETNDFVAAVDGLEREVQRFVDNGMCESAVGLVFHYRERAAKIHDRVVRRRIVSEVNRRFGHLLKGKSGEKTGGGGSGRGLISTQDDED